MQFNDPHSKIKKTFRLNFRPFGPKSLHYFNERASDKQIWNVVSSTPARSTRIFPRYPEEEDMIFTGNDTVNSRKRAEWSPQEANHSLWCYLPVTLSIAAAVADPAGFEATQRKIPSSVKFTWRITRDPVGRILNRSSEGMGWSPFGPDAHAMWGAGWPRALQLNIPDWPWVLVISFGACVIDVGTVEIEKKQNAWDWFQLSADILNQNSLNGPSFGVLS